MDLYQIDLSPAYAAFAFDLLQQTWIRTHHQLLLRTTQLSQ